MTVRSHCERPMTVRKKNKIETGFGLAGKLSLQPLVHRSLLVISLAERLCDPAAI